MVGSVSPSEDNFTHCDVINNIAGIFRIEAHYFQLYMDLGGAGELWEVGFSFLGTDLDDFTNPTASVFSEVCYEQEDF